MTLDLRSLALFRIGLGLFTVTDVVDRARTLSLYTRDAPVPVTALHGVLGLSVHALFQSNAAAATLLVLQALVGVMLVLGVRTRTMLVAALLLAVSVQARSPLSLFSGDTLTRALFVWALFLPVGARFSVDSKLATGAGAHRSVASLALVVQVVLLFTAAGLEKLWAPAWRNGTALDVFLHAKMYAMPLGVVVGDALPGSVLRVLTWAALVVEVVAPLLLFARAWRVRVAALALLAALMTGIALTLGVGLFPVISVAALVALLPTAVWRGAASDLVTTSRRPVNIAAAACLALAVASSAGNAAGFDPRRVTPNILVVTGLVQHWGMFSTPDILWRGWFHVVGTTEHGARLDAFTGAPAHDDVEPPVFAALLPFRARRVWEEALKEQNAVLLPYIAQWACAESPVPLASVAAFYADPGNTGVTYRKLVEADCR